MKRTLIVVCVLLMVIGVFVGCNPGNRTADSTTPPKSGDTKVAEKTVPDSAVKEVYSCIETGDPDKLLSLMVPEEAEKVKADYEKAGGLGAYYFLAKVVKETKATVKPLELKITKGTSKDMVTVETIADMTVGGENNSGELKAELTFEEKDGKWLLKDIKELDVPSADHSEKKDEEKSESSEVQPDELKADEEKTEE